MPQSHPRIRRVRRSSPAAAATRRRNALPAAAAGVLALTVLLGACGEDDPRRPAAGAPGGEATVAPDLPASAPGSVAPAAPTGSLPASPIPIPMPSGMVVPGWDPGPKGDPVEAARQAADAAADTWEKTHPDGRAAPQFIVTGFAGQSGNWETQNYAFKVSLADGCLTMPPGATVPPHPTHGEVRQADGTVLLRPFVEPDAVFGAGLPEALRARCGTAEVPRLQVTSVKLTTDTATTIAGPATVPVWELSFAGTAVIGRAIAVASDHRPPPVPVPSMLLGPPADGFGVTAQLAADGRTLTLAFTGSPDGPGPCGIEYGLEAAQRGSVVAVVISARNRPAPSPVPADFACSLVGASRTATITLDAPLGSRALVGPNAQAVARQ